MLNLDLKAIGICANWMCTLTIIFQQVALLPYSVVCMSCILFEDSHL